MIEAMGIATLRMPMLPDEMPPDRREMVLMAGRASYMMATRNTAAAEKAFEALVARYPETPNVHYAYGVFLLQEQPDKAIEEFKRELELQPEHPWSLMQIAFEYLKRGDAAAALPWAQQAVGGGAERLPGAQGAGAGAARAPATSTARSTELQIAGSSWRRRARACTSRSRRAYQRAGRLDDAARGARRVHAAGSSARAARTSSGGDSRWGGTMSGTDQQLRQQCVDRRVLGRGSSVP